MGNVSKTVGEKFVALPAEIINALYFIGDSDAVGEWVISQGFNPDKPMHFEVGIVMGNQFHPETMRMDDLRDVFAYYFKNARVRKRNGANFHICLCQEKDISH